MSAVIGGKTRNGGRIVSGDRIPCLPAFFIEKPIAPTDSGEASGIYTYSTKARNITGTEQIRICSRRGGFSGKERKERMSYLIGVKKRMLRKLTGIGYPVSMSFRIGGKTE